MPLQTVSYSFRFVHPHVPPLPADARLRPPTHHPVTTILRVMALQDQSSTHATTTHTADQDPSLSPGPSCRASKRCMSACPALPKSCIPGMMADAHHSPPVTKPLHVHPSPSARCHRCQRVWSTATLPLPPPTKPRLSSRASAAALRLLARSGGWRRARVAQTACSCGASTSRPLSRR